MAQIKKLTREEMIKLAGWDDKASRTNNDIINIAIENIVDNLIKQGVEFHQRIPDNPNAEEDCNRCGGSGEFMGDSCTCLNRKYCHKFLKDLSIHRNRCNKPLGHEGECGLINSWR